MKKEDLRIIFMGTPEFAVPSLRRLVALDYNVVAVITAQDKPAGRGKKLTFSAIKISAMELNLPILQPENLKNENFIQQLKSYHANIQIVVAFRMLPEIVWAMPELGTFNLHASLLPQYRGAAPINYAIINGEKETGLTTFFLDKEIDTGAIIKQIKMPIAESETAEQLHDRMMVEGAQLITDTLEIIVSGNARAMEQSEFVVPEGVLKKAPKISKEDCRIDWDKNGKQVENFIRGLSSYPAAFSEFISEKNEVIYLKIYKSYFEKAAHSFENGELFSDGSTFIKAAVPDGFVFITELQQAGKKRIDVSSFLRGNSIKGMWHAKT